MRRRTLRFHTVLDRVDVFAGVCAAVEVCERQPFAERADAALLAPRLWRAALAGGAGDVQP
jgi:hypothetical protein